LSELGGSAGGGDELTPSEAPVPTGTRSDAERKRMLADAVQRQVVQGGRVESQSDFQAVIIHGSDVNHTLHVLISVFTCGLWLIPWLVMGAVGGEKRTVVSIDDYGNVLTQDLGKRK
jgi:hypothetical protein